MLRKAETYEDVVKNLKECGETMEGDIHRTKPRVLMTIFVMTLIGVFSFIVAVASDIEFPIYITGSMIILIFKIVRREHSYAKLARSLIDGSALQKMSEQEALDRWNQWIACEEGKRVDSTLEEVKEQNRNQEDDDWPFFPYTKQNHF